jgi:acyl-CoA thioester hydrolase
MAREDFHFFYPIRVRWAETDAQGVVFHAHFLTYYDTAQTEYLRRIGLPYPEGLREIGADLVLVKATLECLGGVRFDDEIEVMTRVARIGRSSLTFAFEIYREGEEELLVRGEDVYVCVDADGGGSTGLPEALTDRIHAFESGSLTEP